MAKTDLLMAGAMMPMIEEQLDQHFTVHRLHKAADRDKLLAEVGDKDNCRPQTPGSPSLVR